MSSYARRCALSCLCALSTCGSSCGPDWDSLLTRRTRLDAGPDAATAGSVADFAQPGNPMATAPSSVDEDGLIRGLSDAGTADGDAGDAGTMAPRPEPR
jgi:hypothetical protein